MAAAALASTSNAMEGRTDGGWRARAVGRTDGRTGNEQRELASPLAVCKRPKGGEGGEDKGARLYVTVRLTETESVFEGEERK